MIRQELGIFTYTQDNRPEVHLKMSLLESGWFVQENMYSFSHPNPVFNRLFMVRQGSCELLYDSVRYNLSPCQIAILPINATFDVTYLQTELFFFHFTMQIPCGLDVFRTLRKPLIVGGCEETFEYICSNYQPEGMEMSFESQMMLFRFLYQQAKPVLEADPDANYSEGRFSKLLEYIKNNIRADLSIDELAKRMKLSRSALSKGFQRSIGIPLKSHLATMLLQRSREKLAHSDDTIAQIADELAFCDSTYFHRFFKKLTGLTPIQYRRQAKLGHSTQQLT